MKIEKVLTVAGNPYYIVDDNVRLSLYTPGTADFTVVVPVNSDGSAADRLSGIVTFDLGLATSANVHRCFFGVVVNAIQLNDNQQSILCREVTDILRVSIPLSLRHCAMGDVLAAISDMTGLSFRVPDKDYAKTKAPCFYNLSSGIHSLDMLGDVFGIPDYIWVQQSNGEIFCGAWSDSFFADIDETSALKIPEDLFHSQLSSGSFKVAAIPGLRPGFKINDNFITDIQLTGNTMAITCAKLLNASY